jgi:hypothetical protein
MNLLEAHNQWKERAADETFWGLADAFVAAKYIKEHSREMDPIFYRSLKADARSGELVLIARGEEYQLTNCAAQQLCNRAGVPHSFVSKQPAELASRNVNWGLEANRGGDDDACMPLVYDGSAPRMRALTSEKYQRLWHADFIQNIQNLLDDSWTTPPAFPSPARRNDLRNRPATIEDIGSAQGLTSVQVGDTIGPAGVYLSDRDMFVFVVSNKHIDGPSGALCRFALFWNNEIGTGSWGATFGYFDHVCGNHIIWGAKEVTEVRVRHIGRQSMRIGSRSVAGALVAAQSGNATLIEDSTKLFAAARFELGTKREQVVEKVATMARVKRITELTASRVADAFDIAERAGRYGAPNTAWAVTCGLTELSRTSLYGSERTALDRAAGRVLDMVP